MRNLASGFMGGFGRALGRIFAYGLIGLAIFYLFNNSKDDIKSSIKDDIKDVMTLE